MEQKNETRSLEFGTRQFACWKCLESNVMELDVITQLVKMEGDYQDAKVSEMS